LQTGQIKLSIIQGTIKDSASWNARALLWEKREQCLNKGARQSQSRPEVLTTTSLQRTQEVQNILLLAGAEVVVEVEFVGGVFSAVALVGLDGAQQVFAASIVQEEDALAQAPQRRGAELVSAGPALRDIIRQGSAHVVDLNVAEQVGGCVAQAGRLVRR